MSEHKHQLPTFLEGLVQPETYVRWLKRKANAHLKRDKNRGYREITSAAYRDTIHEAVNQSMGKDAYTGEDLDWTLISKYDNEDSKNGKHQYKATFALLPTVDHIDSATVKSGFCICAWQTNDSKHDLSRQKFIELCAKVLKYAGYSVAKDA